jgi:hypothetical protein
VVEVINLLNTGDSLQSLVFAISFQSCILLVAAMVQPVMSVLSVLYDRPKVALLRCLIRTTVCFLILLELHIAKFVVVVSAAACLPEQSAKLELLVSSLKIWEPGRL